MGNKKQNRWVDGECLLTWERYNPTQPYSYEAYNNLVNLWSDDKGIQRFIHFDDKIADTFQSLKKTDIYNAENLFYAFDNDNLAGVVYITAPYDENEETHIEYIIVNPRMKGNGIGTRMISSIKSNPIFFAETHKGTITASIEHTNEASKRAFIKNGFKMYKPALNKKLIELGVYNIHDIASKFGRWYFNERTEEMDK